MIKKLLQLLAFALLLTHCRSAEKPTEPQAQPTAPSLQNLGPDLLELIPSLSEIKTAAAQLKKRQVGFKDAKEATLKNLEESPSAFFKGVPFLSYESAKKDNGKKEGHKLFKQAVLAESYEPLYTFYKERSAYYKTKGKKLAKKTKAEKLFWNGVRERKRLVAATIAHMFTMTPYFTPVKRFELEGYDVFVSAPYRFGKKGLDEVDVFLVKEKKPLFFTLSYVDKKAKASKAVTRHLLEEEKIKLEETGTEHSSSLLGLVEKALEGVKTQKLTVEKHLKIRVALKMKADMVAASTEGTQAKPS